MPPSQERKKSKHELKIRLWSCYNKNMHSLGSARALLLRKLKKLLQKTGIRGASGGILDQQDG